MQKVIKNPENGKYFTNNYRNGFWSRNFEDASSFVDEDSLQYYMQKLRESYDNPFEGIEYIIIETIYKLK